MKQGDADIKTASKKQRKERLYGRYKINRWHKKTRYRISV